MSNRKYRVAVPAGIGDYSWIHSKLSTIPDAQFEVYVPDSYPQRTKPFIDLLPNCKGMLGRHTYPDIMTWGRHRGGKTWEQIVKNYGDMDDVIYLQCNEHLGQGRALADWLPDLKTDYHYKINVAPGTTCPGIPAGKKLFGITMASMRGIRAWNAWLPETWFEFIKLVCRDFPNVHFVFLGGQWDIDTMMELSGLMGNRVDYTDLVGKTSITEAIQILDMCDFFMGYSSGLTVLRTVLDKPCVTLWPKHQSELMYSWADPAMIEKRTYMGFIYDSAERMFLRVWSNLKKVL